MKSTVDDKNRLKSGGIIASPKERAAAALGTHASFLQAYNKGMQINLEDKLAYIMEGVPNYASDIGVVIDFGCADGSLLYEMFKRDSASEIKNKTYIGYDLAPDMIERARATHKGERLIFTDDFEYALAQVKKYSDAGKKSVLVLSSVIHEIVHYQSPEEQRAFWDQVWKSGASYIAIRDFAVPKGMEFELSKPEDVAKVREKYKNKTFPEGHPMEGQNILSAWEHGFKTFTDKATGEKVEGFGGWGPIDNKKSFVHFLMTFDRIIHPRMWEVKSNANLHLKGLREIKEDYTSLPFEDFVSLVPRTYTPIYFERGVTDLRSQKVRDNFSVSLDVPTKMKLIMKRREESALLGTSRHTPETFVKEYQANKFLAPKTHKL